ncbi:negative regulator of flagellin synthesis FlgM [Paenibacillus phyllosphaerae]|uniref:Negative regulator of flagellin synthesis n=1 Tax=Paenibacillus phyllosphaerae TaxID=274593 RepID=A0A7W5AXC9_9BACL|nr:flagellar biosynthesis anti-sigma factor FlgM [Paenibacillus phyllosphaerae]MBB3110498.1 negative regulator of flagellin synthesis FlgM [Paenibacillus phyllosphaerae]
MKINDTRRISGVNPYQKQNEAKAAATTERKRQTDEVKISAEAMEMLSHSRLNDADRTQRIQELKNQVSSGTYKVDADKLADKVLPFIR